MCDHPALAGASAGLWKPRDAGTLRVNRVVEEKLLEVVCGQKDEKPLPESFLDYEEKPREYTLCAFSVVLDVHTRVSDLYSNSYDQVREQLRLSVENVKERQERRTHQQRRVRPAKKCRAQPALLHAPRRPHSRRCRF
jgi:hypothetical protein